MGLIRNGGSVEKIAWWKKAQGKIVKEGTEDVEHVTKKAAQSFAHSKESVGWKREVLEGHHQRMNEDNKENGRVTGSR